MIVIHDHGLSDIFHLFLSIQLPHEVECKLECRPRCSTCRQHAIHHYAFVSSPKDENATRIIQSSNERRIGKLADESRMRRGLFVLKESEWLQNDGWRGTDGCIQFPLFLLLDQHFGQLLTSGKPSRSFGTTLQGMTSLA